MRKMGLSWPVYFFYLLLVSNAHDIQIHSESLNCRCEMQVTQSELSEMLCDSSLLSENSD